MNNFFLYNGLQIVGDYSTAFLFLKFVREAKYRRTNHKMWIILFEWFFDTKSLYINNDQTSSSAILIAV